MEAFLYEDLPAGDYDVVVEASGSPSGLELALARVRPQGTVVMKSTYVGRYPLDPAVLVVPEVRLVGCRCGPFPAPCACCGKAGWTPGPSSPGPSPDPGPGSPGLGPAPRSAEGPAGLPGDGTEGRWRQLLPGYPCRAAAVVNFRLVS